MCDQNQLYTVLQRVNEMIKLSVHLWYNMCFTKLANLQLRCDSIEICSTSAPFHIAPSSSSCKEEMYPRYSMVTPHSKLKVFLFCTH